MNTDTPLVEQLRACAASPRTVAWEGSARQLLRWAADTVEAANYALSERRQNAATQGPATSRSQSEVAPARETVADLPAVPAPDDNRIIDWRSREEDTAQDFIEGLPKRLDDKLGGPVVWACRTKSDGSYSDSVVPVRWTMAEDKLAAMRADPWVQKGLAEIVPLYESPPSATDATARDAARYQFWRKNTAITVPSMTEQLIDEGLDAAMAAVDSSGERNG